MGSVKEMFTIEHPTLILLGNGGFDFSDDYSVFDIGKMPDTIPLKGAALALQGAYFFAKLKERGFPTHFRNLGDDNTRMYTKLVRKVMPKRNDNGTYDYSEFERMQQANEGCYLVPLEVIYRNTLPKGSSVFKRLNKGGLTLEDLGVTVQDILSHAKLSEDAIAQLKTDVGNGKHDALYKLMEGMKLPRTYFDVSTKLESEGDRYLTWDEAYRIAGINRPYLQMELRAMLSAGNEIISDEVSRLGGQNDDGKFEFGLDPRRSLMYIDVLGTQDECRFTIDGIQMSKEIARQFYRRRQPKMLAEIEQYKKDKVENWRELLHNKPLPLHPEEVQLLSDVYTSFTNALYRRNVFPNVPTLEKVVERVRTYSN